MARTTKTQDELLEALEKAVLEILNNKKAKPSEKLHAAAVGLKLVSTSHTVRGSDIPDFFGDADGTAN